MTAYLRPGDKIHVQVPGTKAEAASVVSDLRPIYAALGVEIQTWHAVQGAPGATFEIIAVFRDNEREA